MGEEVLELVGNEEGVGYRKCIVYFVVFFSFRYLFCCLLRKLFLDNQKSLCAI